MRRVFDCMSRSLAVSTTWMFVPSGGKHEVLMKLQLPRCADDTSHHDDLVGCLFAYSMRCGLGQKALALSMRSLPGRRVSQGSWTAQTGSSLLRDRSF